MGLSRLRDIVLVVVAASVGIAIAFSTVEHGPSEATVALLAVVVAALRGEAAGQ